MKRSRARLAALELLSDVFDSTSRLTKAQRETLSRTIEFARTGTSDAGVKLYEMLPADGQADFWRSLALFKFAELEELPTELHTRFWAVVAMCETALLERLRGSLPDEPARIVIDLSPRVVELFPRGAP